MSAVFFGAYAEFGEFFLWTAHIFGTTDTRDGGNPRFYFLYCDPTDERWAIITLGDGLNGFFDFRFAMRKLDVISVARESQDLASAFFGVVIGALDIQLFSLAADAYLELWQFFPRNGVDDLPSVGTNLSEQCFNDARLRLRFAVPLLICKPAKLILSFASENHPNHGSVPDRSGASSSPFA